MHGLVIFQIGAFAIDGLLEIAHHAEVTGPRRIDARLHPITGRAGWSCRLQKHRKLRRLGVLRFIENAAKMLRANARSGERVLQQFLRERDLIAVGDEAALEAKFPVIALHFRGHAGSRLADPFPER